VCPTSSRTDPLVPDLRVTVKYLYMDVTAGADAGFADLRWALRVQTPGQDFEGDVLSNHLFPSGSGQLPWEDGVRGSCPRGATLGTCFECSLRENNVVELNKEKTFTLLRGQGFFLSGQVDEIDVSCLFQAPHFCSAGPRQGGLCVDEFDCPPPGDCAGAPTIARSCHMTFVRAFSFEELQRGFRAEEFTISGNEADCSATVVVQIDVK
jgi:hypothetical protein